MITSTTIPKRKCDISTTLGGKLLSTVSNVERSHTGSHICHFRSASKLEDSCLTEGKRSHRCLGSDGDHVLYSTLSTQVGFARLQPWWDMQAIPGLGRRITRQTMDHSSCYTAIYLLTEALERDGMQSEWVALTSSSFQRLEHQAVTATFHGIRQWNGQ